MKSTCKFHENVLYLSCDGVITDGNGLIYMRARYYSPDMRRFINADVVAGEITNAITLNRFAYANGNPVSLSDPFGLSADNKREELQNYVDNHDSVMYNLAKAYQLDFARTDSRSITQVDQFGISIGLSVEVSHSATAFGDSNYKTEISTKSGDFKHELSTKEYTTPRGNAGVQASAFHDKGEKAVGVSGTAKINEWSYSGAFQVSTTSSKETHTITYKPDDPLAPSVSLKLEIEVDHKTRVTALVVALIAAAVIVFAPYAVPALAKAAGAIGTGTLTGIGAELLQRCPT